MIKVNEPIPLCFAFPFWDSADPLKLNKEKSVHLHPVFWL